MIKKIVFSVLFIDLLLALSIAIYWQIQVPQVPVHTIKLGGSFLAFLKSCNEELNNFKIEIPKIPEEGFLSNVTKMLMLSNPLMAFLNAFIIPIDALMRIANLLIDFLNALISLLQFILILLKNVLAFRDSVQEYSSSSSSIEMIRSIC